MNIVFQAWNQLVDQESGNQATSNRGSGNQGIMELRTCLRDFLVKIIVATYRLACQNAIDYLIKILYSKYNFRLWWIVTRWDDGLSIVFSLWH
jgi:hypothetical protein